MALEKAAKMDKQELTSNVLQLSPPPSEQPRDGHGKKDGGDFSENSERVAGQINNQSAEVSSSEETPSQSRPQSSSLEAPSIKPLVEIKDDAIYITLGDRVYRVLGLYKNNSLEVMNINLMVKKAEGVHVDIFNLYSNHKREGFVKAASEDLGLEPDIIKSDLCKLLFELEDLLQRHIESFKNPAQKPVYQMSEKEEKDAIAFLKSPNLLDLIAGHFILLGIVGETVNCKLLYLVATSRLLPKPLHAMIQSLFGAGKSALMDALLALLPEEAKVIYTAMTGQSLFYLGQSVDLKHKILAIAEEEGLEKVKYALRVLQSEGEISIASTDRDPKTGQQMVNVYKTEGPLAAISGGTNVDMDEELMSRCFSLGMDLSRDQTRAIHDMQRKMETLEGLEMEIEKKKIIQLHQNAQRLLKPILVKNPFANHLKFTDKCHRTRRDHMKYLTLIRAIALLHQYQRPIKYMKKDGVKVPYIEVIIEDIEFANALCNEVLGQSLDDMLPQTKMVLDRIYEMVRSECENQGIDFEHFRFTRRQVREYIGLSDPTLRKHIQRLVDLEYMLEYNKKQGSLCNYELLYRGEGREKEKFLLGLIDTEELKKKIEEEKQDKKNRKNRSL